jgi:dolichyl-phosphate-mannose-protein mannosyltransferase
VPANSESSAILSGMQNSQATEFSQARATLGPWPWAIAALYFLAHMLTATRYGYFRDAVYYLACSEHLDWGYVDQPPLIVLIAWISRHTIGTSLRALLVWPALAGAGRIVLTATFARKLGAKRFGTALAAMLAATPGVWYAIDHQLAMNALEPLIWAACAYAILRMIQTGDPRWWMAFGAIAGIGLENKYSIAVFAFALLSGLLLTRQRRFLFTPWLFAGSIVALLIFLPNLLWNVQHHWPFLELMRNIRASGRDVVLGPRAFFAQQVLIMNPLSLPFWLAGVLYYFFGGRAKDYRAFGWAFVITVGLFFVMHGKNYYAAPVYPLVLAASGLATERLLEKWFAEKPRVTATLKPICFAWLLAGIALFLPLVLPVLPVELYLRYQAHLPFEVPRSEHQHMDTALPQHYGDEFGWEEMVAATARIYHSLTPEEQAKAAIFANNYGEAGAIDFFGPKHGLPKAISAHQNYFLWGPRNYTGEIVILVGSSNPDKARRLFEHVEVAATLNHPYAMGYEHRSILLCRGFKGDLRAYWPKLKAWD